MRDNCITYTQKVNKIRLFDILISDSHANDEYGTIDDTVGLTYHEVWEFISKGGDWDFIVTEHKKPLNIFIKGIALKDMNAARLGEQDMVLGFATQDEMEQISEELHEKASKDFENR